MRVGIIGIGAIVRKHAQASSGDCLVGSFPLRNAGDAEGAVSSCAF